MRQRTMRAAGGRWVSAIGTLLLVAACSPTATPSTGPSAGGGATGAATVSEPTPSPTPAAGAVVHGWPDTSENAAGLYSWDGSDCSTTYCVMGFMHNGYGSGDVTITIESVPAVPIADGGTPASVAGHDGFYRRLDQIEEWFVVIEQRTIAIRLEAKPGTSPTDLAEAHAIIESMRTEPRDNALGFRLVFTLTTDDWDSG